MLKKKDYNLSENQLILRHFPQKSVIFCSSRVAVLKLKYGTALQLLLERNKSATTLKDTGQYNMLDRWILWLEALSGLQLCINTSKHIFLALGRRKHFTLPFVNDYF